MEIILFEFLWNFLIILMRFPRGKANFYFFTTLEITAWNNDQVFVTPIPEYYASVSACPTLGALFHRDINVAQPVASPNQLYSALRKVPYLVSAWWRHNLVETQALTSSLNNNCFLPPDTPFPVRSHLNSRFARTFYKKLSFFHFETADNSVGPSGVSFGGL